MGKICVDQSTGRLREWVRHGELSQFNPAEHLQLEADAPPPDGTRWNGTAWVALPPKTVAEQDADLQAFLDSAGGRALKALVTALVKNGVVTLAEIRAEWRTLT